MGLNITAAADGRTLVVTYPPQVNMESDVVQGLREVSALLGKMTVFPAYQIVDVTALPDLTFSDIVTVLGTVSRSPEGQALMQYDVRVIYVGTATLVKMAAQAMAQEQYGGLQIPVFGTLDEAHDHVKQQIAAEVRPAWS